MTVGSDAPSSKPSPLLHFTLDPLRHKLDARTRANKSRALMNAHISAYDFSHFAAYAGSYVLQKNVLPLCGEAHQWMSRKE